MRAALKSLFSINAASLTLGAIGLALTLYFSHVPLLDLIELKAYDLRMRSRGAHQARPEIVIAAIDEKSLDTEGHWPWPRARIAKLVEVLSGDGARVIGFDIGFFEPSKSGGLKLLDRLQQQLNALTIDSTGLVDFIKANREHEDNDKRLAKAIESSSASIILGYFFHMNKADLSYQLEQSDIDKQLTQIAASKYPLVMSDAPDAAVQPFLKAYVPESNIAVLNESAQASGYFSLASDWDGVIRWMPMMIQASEDLYPPLAVLCAWHYLNKPQLVVQVERSGVAGVQMGERFIPTDASGRLLINYLGPAKTFPRVSAGDILTDQFAPGMFRDKIVIVAATATGIYDVRSTPVGPVYPGGEVHATVIDNILTQQFATRPSWTPVVDFLGMVLMSVLIGIAMPRTSAVGGFLFAAGLCVAHLFLINGVFLRYGMWFNVIYPLLSLFVTYAMLSVYYYVTEERERQKIKGAFTQYVSSEVIEEILKEPERLQLGGEERVLTVLFSDLQGFTALSERYSPLEITEILSEYYTGITEELFAHEGTLISYVGDEIVAVFGAPIEQSDQTEKACAAALDMRDRRVTLNRAWAERGRPILEARTGLNTGLMLVGNLGSEYRFSYNVLGDHVNLGSRLEGLNKLYDTEILISETTAAAVGDKFTMREIDTVRVVGRDQPLRVFELLGLAEAGLPAQQERAHRDYAAGLAAYREAFWDEALGLFQTSLTSWPEDGPSRTMIERCLIYQHAPPPETWGGVFDAQEK